MYSYNTVHVLRTALARVLRRVVSAPACQVVELLILYISFYNVTFVFDCLSSKSPRMRVTPDVSHDAMGPYLAFAKAGSLHHKSAAV